MSDSICQTKVPLGCQQPQWCPLSRVKSGTCVRIKQLSAPPEVTQRLREMGLGEEQQIKLISRQGNVICQVCSTRLALSAQLAEIIFVEPLAERNAVA